LRVLVVTNLYPTTARPHLSPFVKEQVASLLECDAGLSIDVRVIEGQRPRWPYVREMLQLPGIVRRGRYDVVHAHFGLTLVSTQFVRAPVVVTFHGSDLLVNPTKYVSRFLAPSASGVIVVAQRLKESLGYGDVIPCGIRVEDFALPAGHRSGTRPRDTGRLRVLFPSDTERVIKDYGLFRAVRQELERMGRRVEEVHLVNVDRARVREVYWDCDLLLLTSRSEGSPTVIKEAIAAKLPFVSVDVGDVAEWAAAVHFGVVVRERDPRLIAEAATALVGRVTDRAGLDNAACLDAMDITKVAQRIRGVYREVLGAAAKGRTRVARGSRR